MFLSLIHPVEVAGARPHDRLPGACRLMKRLLMVGLGPVHLHVLHQMAALRVAGAEVIWLAAPAQCVWPASLAASLERAGSEFGATLPDHRLALADVWRRADVQVVANWPTSLDTRARRVGLPDGRELSYDILSLDLATHVDRDAVPGAREHALFLHPLESLVTLWPTLQLMMSQRSLDVVVVGGGAAAYEAVMLLSAHRGADAGLAARVVWVTGDSSPLSQYPQPLRERAVQCCKARGVTVLPAQCVAIEPGWVRLDNGARVACDAPVMATSPQPAAWWVGSGLILDDHGWPQVLPSLQSVSSPEVFVSRWGAGLSSGGEHDTPGSWAQLGAALTDNLRRAVGGGEIQDLPRLRPSWAFLRTGHGQALASRGRWVMHGRWVAQWQSHQADALWRKLQLSSSDGR